MTAVGSAPVAYAIMDLDSAIGQVVFVIDNFQFEVSALQQVDIPRDTAAVKVDHFCDRETEYAQATHYRYVDAFAVVSDLYLKHNGVNLYVCVEGAWGQVKERFFAVHLDQELGEETVPEQDDLSLRGAVESSALSSYIGSGSRTTPWSSTTIAGATEQVRWAGSDADNDSLTYSLFYRRGEGDWELLATGMPTTSYPVEVDLFAGGTTARFRVVATDGVNMAVAESAPVTIPNKAPLALISDPTTGRSFTPGALVVLQGSALDLEDGRLADEALHWSSDRQGNLGTGPSLPVNTLAPGLHTITLSVQDSNGANANATTTIFVGYQLYLPAVVK